ncbi:MAG: hypothetical protein V9F82_04190 [Dermatophilaceae bacterium]
MSVLGLLDADAYADLARVVALARAADPGAAVRLQAVGGVLRVYVGVLPGRGLLAEGAAVGARGVALADPADLDVAVAAAALADRFARDPLGPGLAVPAATVHAPWVGSLPSTSGWAPAGRLDPAELKAVARAGIAEIAGATAGPVGQLAVGSLRERVWGRAVPADPPVPAGTAFAAYVLGLLGQRPVEVSRQGRWVRLATGRGHVLGR